MLFLQDNDLSIVIPIMKNVIETVAYRPCSMIQKSPCNVNPERSIPCPSVYIIYAPYLCSFGKIQRIKLSRVTEVMTLLCDLNYAPICIYRDLKFI